MDRLLEATYRVEQQHFWWKGLRAFARPLVADALASRPSPRILDCGCGTGANLVMLGEFGHASGFDLTFRGLEFARAYGVRRVTQASITDMPFGDATFDLVTAFDVLYSLTEEQRFGGWPRFIACSSLAGRSSSTSRRCRSFEATTRSSVPRCGDRRGVGCAGWSHGPGSE